MTQTIHTKEKIYPEINDVVTVHNNSMGIPSCTGRLVSKKGKQAGYWVVQTDTISVHAPFHLIIRNYCK